MYRHICCTACCFLENVDSLAELSCSKACIHSTDLKRKKTKQNKKTFPPATCSAPYGIIRLCFTGAGGGEQQRRQVSDAASPGAETELSDSERKLRYSRVGLEIRNKCTPKFSSKVNTKDLHLINYINTTVDIATIVEMICPFTACQSCGIRSAVCCMSDVR